MREIKIQVLFEMHDCNFNKIIAKHHTTFDRLTNGLDNFDYKDSVIIVNRQFIGLLDNQLNEIYHQDIILDHVGVGLVIWDVKNASFKVSYRGKDQGMGKWFTDYNKKELKTIVILGNLYQNPELIK